MPNVFRIEVLGENGLAVPSYFMNFPADCVSRDSSLVAGSSSVIKYAGSDYHVAETTTEIEALSNVVATPEPTSEAVKGLISQSGTDAPVLLELNQLDEDYLGEIIWTYQGVGLYRGTLTGLLTVDKTMIYSITKTDGTVAIIDLTGLPDYFEINTTANGLLNKASFKIEVAASSL